MKGLWKYLKEDFDSWLNDPLYRGGWWEDCAIGIMAAVALALFIWWTI